MEQKRKKLDWLIVLGAFVFNILFFFVPLGEETGFRAAWDVSPWFGIPMGLLALGFFVGRLVMSIKKW